MVTQGSPVGVRARPGPARGAGARATGAERSGQLGRHWERGFRGPQGRCKFSPFRPPSRSDFSRMDVTVLAEEPRGANETPAEPRGDRRGKGSDVRRDPGPSRRVSFGRGRLHAGKILSEH